MSRNVEAKYAVPSLDNVRSAAAALADRPSCVLQQTDTFFTVPAGRLKLRVESSGDPRSAHLIAYHRPDQDAARISHYEIYFTNQPERLKETLSHTCAIIAEVIKARELYLTRNTRIHLDTVQDLGTFVEIEVVMDPNETEEDAQREFRRVADALGLNTDWIEPAAYVDLLIRTK